MSNWFQIEANERKAVGWATAWFFFILLGYLVIRPVRETMGSVIGTAGLQTMMWCTLAVMLVAVPVYSWLVARLPRRWLVRVVYHFFTACLVAFFCLMQLESELVQTWTPRVFFVWVNVFALFATSVFWSVLADIFDHRQGKRIFGIVAAGGTAGAITGSLLTSQIAGLISTPGLLLIPVFTIQAGLWCAWRLEKQTPRFRSELVRSELVRSELARSELANELSVTDADTGATKNAGGVLSGIFAVAKSPYLASICLFLFFVQAFGTQLYFQQAEIVSDAFETKELRVQFFAYLDLGTQVLTLLIQSFAAGWVLRRFGVGLALIALPLVYLFVFTSLAVSPVLAVLVVSMIATRSVGYGMTVPAREVLFTVVSTEQKYKSKNFIDTVVLRGGDALSGAIFSAVRQIGTTAGVMNIAALPMVAFWGWVAWRLGNRQSRLAKDVSLPEQ